MAQSDFSDDTVDDSPEGWAKRLKANKDYRSLAAVFNSECHYSGLWEKQKLARSILREARGEAVDAIMEEITEGGVGRHELAELLVAIGDPTAVPLIKRMLDQGEFSAIGERSFERFVNRYPELQPKAEISTCALCGKERPVTEMRMVRPNHFFCLDTCWNRRGKIVGSKNAGALNCPYYAEGMCTVDGSNTCSLSFGDYATTCYVYRIGKTRRF